MSDSLKRICCVSLLFTIVCSVTGSRTKPKRTLKGWNALKVTYGRDGQGYYDLPWSVEEATAGGKWQKIDQDRKFNVDVFSQPQDPRLMLLFDKRGTIAGIRMAFLKNDIVRKPKAMQLKFNLDYYDDSPQYQKGNYFGKSLWYTTVFFTYTADLAWFDGRRTPSKDKDDVVDGISFIDAETEHWSFFPHNECSIVKHWRRAVEGYCADGLGKHYFLKEIEINGCSHMVPTFATYNGGKLVGFGLGGYGSISPNSKFTYPMTKTVNFYDNGDITLSDLMYTVPECIKENIDKFGSIIMHVFLQKNASKIICPRIDWNVPHCFAPRHALPWFEPFSG